MFCLCLEANGVQQVFNTYLTLALILGARKTWPLSVACLREGYGPVAERRSLEISDLVGPMPRWKREVGSIQRPAQGGSRPELRRRPFFQDEWELAR